MPTITHPFYATIFAGLLSLGASSGLIAGDSRVIVQSTTSAANSGLYDYLLPRFKQESGIQVHIVAVGTGQAIKNARNCDADLLLVHDQASEQQFVADGYGIERRDLMYNDFILVGPVENRAGIEKNTSIIQAFKKIAATESLFVSRGDHSGTHKKERQLWQSAALEPRSASGSWYREVGSGMGAALNAAVAMGAYTITDRATWLSYSDQQDLVIQLEGDRQLLNQYGIIIVNPRVCPRVNLHAAQTFSTWLLSAAGQSAIGRYRVKGKQLFFPNAR